MSEELLMRILDGQADIKDALKAIMDFLEKAGEKEVPKKEDGNINREFQRQQLPTDSTPVVQEEITQKIIIDDELSDDQPEELIFSKWKELDNSLKVWNDEGKVGFIGHKLIKTLKEYKDSIEVILTPSASKWFTYDHIDWKEDKYNQ